MGFPEVWGRSSRARELREVRPWLEGADKAATRLEHNRKRQQHTSLPADSELERRGARAESLAGYGLDVVAQLLEDVHPDFVRVKPLFSRRRSGRPIRPLRKELALTSTTLLGEVAFGLYQQLLGARGIATCALAECGRLFSPRDRRTKYHSRQCRKKAHPEDPRRRKLYMREYRKRQR